MQTSEVYGLDYPRESSLKKNESSSYQQIILMSTALVVCQDTETRIGRGKDSPFHLDECVVLFSFHFCNGPRYLGCVLSMPVALSG